MGLFYYNLHSFLLLASLHHRVVYQLKFRGTSNDSDDWTEKRLTDTSIAVVDSRSNHNYRWKTLFTNLWVHLALKKQRQS